ncbi:MAG: PucR family transcriptional regulator ligand-binding domain-containing protein [Nocardioidaceae bacterium]|nr:PucR family transcriptional regulator ligand-binding domain-containing protein [Nocardioidaceae bacterium]
MALSVADLLALPVMQAARAEVLRGADLDRRRVRWVHTSEIYEIAPLLSGGEVLLTTGLGLVGHTPDAMGDYVRGLARRGVAALVLELGRTFPDPPAAVVAAAEESGLPLVVLHGVVPFIQITETVHPLLLDDELRRLRYTDRATVELHRAILAESGVSDMVALVEALCEAPVGLYDEQGELAVGADVDPDGSVTVEVAGSPRMHLAVATEPDRRRLVELCASSLAVCLAAERRRAGHRGSAAADLLHDLADESYYVTSADIAARARSVGFTVHTDERALGLVVETTGSASTGVRAATTALRRAFGSCLIGAVDGEVLAAVSTRPALLRARLDQAAESLTAELASTVGGRVVRLVAGPLVGDAAGLARSLPAAREAARMANTLVIESQVVLSNDLGVYRLLSSVVSDLELEQFVNDQLGPLLELDARTGSELVPTLDAYLDAGLSKTAAAAALGIRRQTLYARLERIGQTLAGVDLGDRRRRTAVDLALVSWRLRTAAASYRR